MSSFFRSCSLAVLVSSSLFACDPESSDAAPIETRAGDPTGTPSEGSLRVLDDPHDLVYVEGLELQVLVDPASAPKDISTGVIESEAMVLVDGPFGSPLKLKLKIVVLPAGPTAE